MSLSIAFSSPVTRDFKVEQTAYSLAEINFLGGVRRDNVFVGHSVPVLSKTLVLQTIFSFARVSFYVTRSKMRRI